jgi:hypothetical protein
MTEASPLNDSATAARLKSEWHAHWDTSRRVLIEKTPGNLLRMRLLDRLFEPSSFVIVTRHPIACALATMKWTEGNLFSLLFHWVHCHRIARDDARHVRNAIWINYERLVADPEAQIAILARYLGLEPRHAALPPIEDRNPAYFARWRSLYCGDLDRAIPQKPPQKLRSLPTRLCERIARDVRERLLPPHRRRENLRHFHDALDAVALLEPAVAEFGYSLIDLERKPDA